MYKYFVPDEPDKNWITAQVPSVPVNAMKDIVPLYNEQGQFIRVLCI